MADKLLPISVAPQEQHLFRWFAGITLASILGGIALDAVYLAALPVILLLGFVTVVDYKKVYYLLLGCIPFSVEIALPNGLATDLPTEPLMIGLMGVYFLYVLRHAKEMNSNFIRHPLSVLLLLHLLWVVATTITSSLLLVSIKFSLAKLWYIVVFFFMAGSIFKTERAWKVGFWSILLPLLTTVLIVVGRHAMYGFTFDTVAKTLGPFYRNHVNYAALMALFIPFVWFARQWYPKGHRVRWFLNGSIALLLIAIQLSYTRTAYVTLFMAVGAFFVVHFRLVKLALFAATIAAVLGFAYMYHNNNYMDYAPDFEHTVVHQKFDNLVEATVAGEDISTMERFYRWIGGFRMIKEKPMVGYGPGNFYNFYKPYTLNTWRTYVSDNPEQSSIHSYYLLMMVEQGFPGMIIFLLLTFYALIRGERVYHESDSSIRKGLVMSAILCLIVIDAFLLINDMMETDKMGPFYFISIALLVNMDLLNKNDRKAIATENS